MLSIKMIYSILFSPAPRGEMGNAFDYLKRRMPYLSNRYKAKDLQETPKIVLRDIL